MLASASADTALFWAKLDWIGVSFVGSVFLHLAFIFPVKRKIIKIKPILALIYLPALTLLYLTFFTGLIIKGVQPESWSPFYFLYGKAFSYWALYMEIVLITGLYLFFMAWYTSDKLSDRRKAMGMFIASIVPIIGASFTNIILPIFNIYLFPVGTSLIVFSSIIIAYSIMKYNEMFVTPATVADTIIDTMPDSLILLNPQGKIIKANKKVSEILGYSSYELEGQMIDLILSPGTRIVNKLIGILLKKGFIDNYEVVFISKNSERISVSLNGVSLNDDDGEIKGLLVIARDIRENKKLMLTLASYQSNLEKIVEQRTDEIKGIHEKLKQSYLAVLKILARLLEIKDPYLREHSLRVTYYAIDIASELGFGVQELELIENTGFLHDLGKIGVDAELLKKKGSLNNDEINAIREHPVIGEKFIDPAIFFNVEQTAIRHHHERYDGTGYPDGLKADEIPIFARILAVADAYDAMISDRPYRKPVTEREAVEEIKINSGTQFDPKIVEAFLSAIKKKNKPKRKPSC